MKVLTTEQIRMADEYTILNEPISPAGLMERAAGALTGWVNSHFPGPVTIRIFAGPGNNGGDGKVMARLLAQEGREVHLHTLQTDAELPEISPDDLVVDAIFGSGLNREPDGIMAACIDLINRSGATVISVDIPSGLFGESNGNNSYKHVVRADITLTLEMPKLSLFLPENQLYTGDWHVIPIALHPVFLAAADTPWHYMTMSDCRPWIKKRKKFGHKGIYGHALLICGSKGKAGAAVLSAEACIHTGCGLTTLHLPDGLDPILQSAVPEAMTLVDPDPLKWTSVPDVAPYQAIGAGPGIGTHPETGNALSELIRINTKPIVLDADALNLIAQNPDLLAQIPKNSILTPHPGEFRRLFGDYPDDYSRMENLRGIASKLGLVIVLKGAHTAVAGPDGTIWFNTTGNPGMATGGSGDVLTGMVTSLLAQGYEPFTAARLAVYIHGTAGDIAARLHGEEALVARDIIACIGQAFIRIKSESI
ncbi:MAG: NAD(P)H-hydrate dehydratase [Bacteroidetes bacterium GWF2_49_14]|nr:MAG: NAD(P)H-hydrate dehydratase [Bacteroidetes bacterium GWF2_49_14]